MVITELVKQMRTDGVEVTTDNGKILLSGSKASVDSWLPVIRDRRQEIVAWLMNLDYEMKAICSGMDKRGRLAGDYFRSLILEKCREDAGERAVFLFAEPKKGA